MKLLIKNGYVVDPVSKLAGKFDILIVNGRIQEVETHIKAKSGIDIVDAQELIVCPGFVDMHVHLREPGHENKETIATGAKAAVAGGFTSVACMANTDPVNDHRSVTEYIIARAKDIGLANVFPIAAISKNLEGEHITEMADLVEGGAVAFSDDGRCVMSAGLIRKALEYAKMLDAPIIEHPEDHSISAEGQVNEGFISYKYGLRGILNASEEVIVARDIILQEHIRSRLHLTHISTAGSIDLVTNAKKKGINVTADVTPHHLLLTEEFIREYDTVFKVKPPLRTEIDRQALIKALQAGIIDCIASDHAPHTRDEKDKEFEYAPFGIIGLETTFSVIYDRLVRTKVIDLPHLVLLLSTHPASILRLYERGQIKPGYHGDLTLVDISKKFKISSEKFYSKARNCPFNGWEGQGVVTHTIVGGKVVHTRH